jgi:hypothetical protein
MTLGFARGLRGLEAGVVGGLAMIALLTSGALLRGYFWWQPANLLGSTFYGARAFRLGLGWATVAGYAFHIVITGMVGTLFGLACGGLERRRRLLLLGGLAGLIWYFFAAAVFWSWVNPLVPIYSLQPDTLMAHVLFGMCLGRIGQVPAPEVQQAEVPPPLPTFYGDPGIVPNGELNAEPHAEPNAELVHAAPVQPEPMALRWVADSAQTLEDKVE